MNENSFQYFFLTIEQNCLSCNGCHFRIRTEEEKSSLEGHIQELCKERDAEIQNCEELKLQLHLAEDKVDSLQSQLQDTAHRLKESLYSIFSYVVFFYLI